jgi:hypothetical protein
MKNLESAIEKFESKVKYFNDDPLQLIELKSKIDFYKTVANQSTHWDYDEICDASNRIHEFILEVYKFNTDWDVELMDYLLRASDKEAANYLLNDFYPRFEEFIKSYANWVWDGNVMSIEKNLYSEQTTQWKLKFTEEQLIKFYIKEYCSDQFDVIY